MASKIALQQMKMNKQRNEPLIRSKVESLEQVKKIESQKLEESKKTEMALNRSRAQSRDEKNKSIAAWKKSDEEIAEEWLKSFK